MGVSLLGLEDVGLTVLQDTPTCPATFLNPDLVKLPPWGEEASHSSCPAGTWLLH